MKIFLKSVIFLLKWEDWPSRFCIEFCPLPPKSTACTWSFKLITKILLIIRTLYANSGRHWLSDYSLFSNDRAQKSQVKQTTKNILYHLPENTNAYQFMQIENSDHQPTSPATSQILKPIQRQSKVPCSIPFLQMRKLILRVDTFSRSLLWDELHPLKFICCSSKTQYFRI